jgi:uracil phosphoribosyltransferase
MSYIIGEIRNFTNRHVILINPQLSGKSLVSAIQRLQKNLRAIAAPVPPLGSVTVACIR